MPRYLAQAGYGQLDLLGRARPIDEVVQDPDTPTRTAMLLAEIAADQGVRPGLRPLDPPQLHQVRPGPARGGVVWFVGAADPLKFKPLKWCFPIAGCFAGLGWFDEDDAVQHKLALDKKRLRHDRAPRRRLLDRRLVPRSRAPRRCSAAATTRSPSSPTSSSTSRSTPRCSCPISRSSTRASRRTSPTRSTDHWIEERFGPGSPEELAWTLGQALHLARVSRQLDAYTQLKQLYEGPLPREAKLAEEAADHRRAGRRPEAAAPAQQRDADRDARLQRRPGAAARRPPRVRRPAPAHRRRQDAGPVRLLEDAAGGPGPDRPPARASAARPPLASARPPLRPCHLLRLGTDVASAADPAGLALRVPPALAHGAKTGAASTDRSRSASRGEARLNARARRGAVLPAPADRGGRGPALAARAHQAAPGQPVKRVAIDRPAPAAVAEPQPIDPYADDPAAAPEPPEPFDPPEPAAPAPPANAPARALRRPAPPRQPRPVHRRALERAPPGRDAAPALRARVHPPPAPRSARRPPSSTSAAPSAPRSPRSRRRTSSRSATSPPSAAAGSASTAPTAPAATSTSASSTSRSPPATPRASSRPRTRTSIAPRPGACSSTCSRATARTAASRSSSSTTTSSPCSTNGRRRAASSLASSTRSSSTRTARAPATASSITSRTTPTTSTSASAAPRPTPTATDLGEPGAVDRAVIRSASMDVPTLHLVEQAVASQAPASGSHPIGDALLPRLDGRARSTRSSRSSTAPATLSLARRCARRRPRARAAPARLDGARRSAAPRAPGWPRALARGRDRESRRPQGHRGARDPPPLSRRVRASALAAAATLRSAHRIYRALCSRRSNTCEGDRSPPGIARPRARAPPRARRRSPRAAPTGPSRPRRQSAARQSIGLDLDALARRAPCHAVEAHHGGRERLLGRPRRRSATRCRRGLGWSASSSLRDGSLRRPRHDDPLAPGAERRGGHGGLRRLARRLRTAS